MPVAPARALVFALLLSASVGCTREPQAPVVQQRRDVPIFIISIDTLRSDRLPAYGYAAGSTPAIDRLRRDSVLFRNAFSHCPQTLPSHAALFTGQLPPVNGVRDNIGYVLKSEETLAAILRRSGYATGAAISSYVLRRSSGIATGFDFFDDTLEYDRQLVKTSAERDGDRARQALQSWIGEQGGAKVFGFLHLYEPHAPYRPPAPFNGGDGYDGEISYADAIVGRFLDFLRQRGLYDDALIIVLSDHGEGLGDHGEQEHGLFVYRESIQVPLLVKLPANSRSGEAIERVVGLVDVLPTVLRAAGLPPLQSKHDGRDLFEPSPGRRIYAETYFPRLHFGWHELKSMVDDRFHYIQAPYSELYAFKEDPRESRNLLQRERRTAFAMAKELEPLATFEPPSAVDPEDQRKLAALGYVGSASGSGGAAADPKEKIAVFIALRKAFTLVLNGEEADALPILLKLVEKEPDIADAWWLLSQSLRKEGRTEEALRALKRGLQRSPTNTNLTLAMADLLYSMGRDAEARQHAQLAISGDPVLGGELLARAELKRGDLGTARRGAELAHASAPDRTETLMLLADIARKEGKPGAELRYLDEAAEGIRRRNLAPVEGLEFRRGEALLGAGRIRESEAAFRNETEQFRTNRQAWSSLALVVGAQGRREEARAILREALKANRTQPMLALALESLETMSDDEGARELRRELALESGR